MVKLVSKIISKIKHREYIIDENITDNDLFSIVFTRFFMLIRGFFATIGFKKRGKISFIGKKVCIKSKSHIECGSGLTINDNCTINALCKGGIKIGNNFSLGQNSIIECTGVIRELGESLVIGDNVGISANAFISSSSSSVYSSPSKWAAMVNGSSSGSSQPISSRGDTFNAFANSRIFDSARSTSPFSILAMDDLSLYPVNSANVS